MKQYPELVKCLIAAAVLLYALRLSAGDRGPVDYGVLGLVGGYLAWQLLRLLRRLTSS